jgi:hypothetical protein
VSELAYAYNSVTLCLNNLKTNNAMKPQPELLNYIKACRDVGMPDGRIRARLLERGWNRQSVLAALPLEEVKEPAKMTAPPQETKTVPAADPEPLPIPEDYIRDSRDKGIDDIATIEHMQEHGWRNDIIANALEHTLPGTPGATIPVHSRSLKRWKLVQRAGLLTAVIALCIGIGGQLLPAQKEPSASAESIRTVTTIKDLNYRLVLPDGWQASSDYNSGAGVNIFYQTGDATVRKSRMTIFVTPVQTAHKDHVATQAESLRLNGGTAMLVNKETIQLGTTTGTLQLFRTTAASNPDSATYYAFLAVRYDQTEYNIDVMSPDAQWQNNKDAVLASLKTFRPQTRVVTHK